MPKPTPPQTTVTIDAAGKVLGRVATQAAIILRGKHKPTFRPDAITGEKVIIENALKVRLTGNKEQTKLYHHFSGYAGGLSSITFKDKLKKDPISVFNLAIKRMLPDNRQRKFILKRLTVKP